MNRVLEISRRSLLAYQQALNVTAHNIGNASNPDYSRQRPIIRAEDPEYKSKLWLGSGATLEDVQRVKNQVLENNYRLYTSQYSYSQKQSTVLQTIESLMGDPKDTGLSSLINSFFNSFSELTANPTSEPLRQNVIQASDLMSSKFSSIMEGYNIAEQDLKTEAENIVTKINTLTQEIATINKGLYEQLNSQTGMNDMLDKRDAAVLELSQYANINVSYDSNNLANVSIGGVFAVDLGFQRNFAYGLSNGKMVVTYENDPTTRLTLTGGELGAITNSYNKIIPKYRSEMETIGQTLFAQVNAIHSSGYTVHEPPATGIDFFQDYSNGSFTINKNVLDDNRFIAASGNGDQGDNTNAKKLSDLRNTAIISGYTIPGYYEKVTGDLGGTIQLMTQKSETYDLAKTQISEQRSAYSGVNLDEEWTNVLKFQRSYDASAKLIKVADEMMQVVLNMI